MLNGTHYSDDSILLARLDTAENDEMQMFEVFWKHSIDLMNIDHRYSTLIGHEYLQLFESATLSIQTPI